MTLEPHPDLFGAHPPSPAPVYPHAAGYRKRDTSRAAAKAIEPKAKTLRERVLDLIREMPCTPETAARRLAQPVHSLRPRFSELSAQGLIEDSGARGRAMGGKKAIIWVAVKV